MKNLIVGAGLSGAVLANLIAENLDEQVVLIDKRDHIGGNIHDYKDDNTGITIHKYGPHIFHTNNKKVWDYLSKFTKWHYYFFKPNVVIEGHYAALPFNLTTLYDVFSSKMAQNLEEKLIFRYGYGAKVPILDLKQNADKDLEFVANYVYENVFKNYTAKQWGMNPEEIDPSVTARVPIYISHDNRYFQDKYQAIPAYGYTKMIENIINHKNIELRLKTDYKDITEEFDRVFYSGAIDEYFDYKYGELPYRSLSFDIQTINKEYYQKTAMTNYPNNYDFTRITEFKHFLSETSDNTVISVEYPEQFVQGKNERFYPIQTPSNQELYDKYKNEASQIPNLHFIGRLGEYKYYNMDSAVENVFKKFEELCMPASNPMS